jgi:DNA-directed RNA polymerase subunit RPC12/RpoP
MKYFGIIFYKCDNCGKICKDINKVNNYHFCCNNCYYEFMEKEKQKAIDEGRWKYG